MNDDDHSDAIPADTEAREPFPVSPFTDDEIGVVDPGADDDPFDDAELGGES